MTPTLVIVHGGAKETLPRPSGRCSNRPPGSPCRAVGFEDGSPSGRMRFSLSGPPFWHGQRDFSEIVDIQSQILGGAVGITMPQYIANTFERHVLPQQTQCHGVTETMKATSREGNIGIPTRTAQCTIYSRRTERTPGPVSTQKYLAAI